MPHQVCHAHCPQSAVVPAAAVAVAAVAAAGATIGAWIGDILLTAGIVVTLLVVAGTWLLVHLLRRDRRETTGRPMVRSLADVQQGQLSAPAPVRQAITGVHVITDARELPETARITIKRDGAQR